jgi:hypothetical protein
MSERMSRFAPLTGVLFAVLAVVAVFSNSSESPEASASATKVVSFFTEHRSSVETQNILFALAFLVLLLFAGVLRSYLRRTEAAEGLGSLVLAGGVLMAAGALTASGLEYGLAHNIHDLSPETAKTVNFIGRELFLPVLAGGFVFGVSSGLAIMRGAPLPKWLGWAAIVIGVVTLIPPASEFALLAFVIWTVIVASLMYMRGNQPARAPSEPIPLAT